MYLPGLWPGIPLSEGCIYLGCGLGFLCRGVYLPGLWPGIPLSGVYLPGLWPGIPLSEGCIYLGCGLGFLCRGGGVFTWAVTWDSSV